MPADIPPKPSAATAALALADGTVMWGKGVGAEGTTLGEVCFNTSMTGYQEIMTDPSYAGQIVTFTFPHVGNVGTNEEDIETVTPAARGLILRRDITEPSNWRSDRHLDAWLKSHNLTGIAGLDTRRLTRRIRDGGAPAGAIGYAADGNVDVDALLETARGFPGLEGMDLAAEVSCRQPYDWDESLWTLGEGYGKQTSPRFNVVAMDFGAKRNILRCLADAGCAVTVVPADASADDILARKPDGVFLSNGPGDPAATGAYAVPTIRKLLQADVPLFGICLGHQMLARALGAATEKMHLGHRGANHPVKDLATGKVEITSQNHGFVVTRESLPGQNGKDGEFGGVSETHHSLFDSSLEGIRADAKRAFSVQYHPEASPGPRDSHYLFRRFTEMMAAG